MNHVRRMISGQFNTPPKTPDIDVRQSGALVIASIAGSSYKVAGPVELTYKAHAEIRRAREFLRRESAL